MVTHPVTDLEIQNFYQKEPKSHSVYSKNNLPKIMDQAL